MPESNQNTPNLTDNFNRATGGENIGRSADRGSQTENHDIVTASELKKLESERQAPTLTYELKPTGVEMRDVNEHLNQQREARIAHLKDRLNEAKDRFERNFERSK